MRLEYQFRAIEYWTAGHDKRIYGERVKPGWILKVLTCFLHLPDSKINDVATILVHDGSHELEIRSRARDAAKQGMSALNPFYVGQYQRIIGQTSRFEDTEHMCLTVIGEMIPLKKWRKGRV
ncbi:unnamed protein product [marine sediment metagenome]|uniref:Uncharacterized protein n=1 Tax=marine sediment metagenome TaxID=412755 RepID=X1FF97_9ZZZZ